MFLYDIFIYFHKAIIYIYIIKNIYLFLEKYLFRKNNLFRNRKGFLKKFGLSFKIYVFAEKTSFNKKKRLSPWSLKQQIIFAGKYNLSMSSVNSKELYTLIDSAVKLGPQNPESNPNSLFPQHIYSQIDWIW